MSTELNIPGVRIAWFDDLGTGNEDYRFLSNFYEGDPLPVFGEEWPTGEHAFQAIKATDSRARDAIRDARSPGEAKRMGRACTLRPDWEEVKYDVMAAVVRSKFDPGRVEGALLLGTGDALLVEGTYWHDRVWGIDLNALGNPGRNWLGTLLMARRAELRAMRGPKNPFVAAHPTRRWNEQFVDGSPSVGGLR